MHGHQNIKKSVASYRATDCHIQYSIICIQHVKSL